MKTTISMLLICLAVSALAQTKQVTVTVESSSDMKTWSPVMTLSIPAPSPAQFYRSTLTTPTPTPTPPPPTPTVTVTPSATPGTVKLAWSAPADSTITGYNIYSGQQTGVYTKHLDAGNVSTYTIGGFPASGVTYLVVKSYNAAGVESAASNEITVTTP